MGKRKMRAIRLGVRIALHEENWPMGIANMLPRTQGLAYRAVKRKMLDSGRVGTLRWESTTKGTN